MSRIAAFRSSVEHMVLLPTHPSAPALPGRIPSLQCARTPDQSGHPIFDSTQHEAAIVSSSSVPVHMWLCLVRNTAYIFGYPMPVQRGGT